MPKPRKRPAQDRSRFTVEAIYDAYVRIWRRDGPAAATTRAVAAEAGFAVGTLYEYFPNREALHSGYVRHTIDLLLAALDREEGRTGPWRERLARLVAVTCGTAGGEPFFDVEMLHRTQAIAEPRHNNRVFEEIAGKWMEIVAGWDDLERKPARETVDALVLALWGARRYRLLLDPPEGRLDGWVGELARLCEAAMSPTG